MYKPSSKNFSFFFNNWIVFYFSLRNFWVASPLFSSLSIVNRSPWRFLIRCWCALFSILSYLNWFSILDLVDCNLDTFKLYLRISLYMNSPYFLCKWIMYSRGIFSKFILISATLFLVATAKFKVFLSWSLTVTKETSLLEIFHISI